MLETNKIYQGDCLEIMKDIDDKSVEMILTDIPYGVVNRKSNGLRKLHKDKADIIEFDLNIFLEECNRIFRGSMYIFCASEQVSQIRQTFVDYGLTTRLGIWEKTNPSPMNGQHLWLSNIECCVFARRKGAIFNEHCKGSVWRFPNGRSKIHPTEKPLKLFQYLIETSSNEGDLILDSCVGSGTTAIACINTNRNYIGIEKEEKYFDIANKRIENHSQQVKLAI